MRPRAWIAAIAVIAGGCGGATAELTPAEAARLPTDGQLWSLCPVPDVSEDFRARVSSRAQARARALIAEVRRRPSALVTLHYEDSHTREPFTETMTVRELARVHLENPGIDGVPCQRKLMAELQAAVDGQPAPQGVENERTYTLREVVAGLQLEKREGIYRSPDGCEISGMFFERRDVEAAEPMENIEIIVSPRGRVGVEVFSPSAACRKHIAQDLARLDAPE